VVGGQTELRELKGLIAPLAPDTRAGKAAVRCTGKVPAVGRGVEMSETPQGPGWWLASDGRYYAPYGPSPEGHVANPPYASPGEPAEPGAIVPVAEESTILWRADGLSASKRSGRRRSGRAVLLFTGAVVVAVVLVLVVTLSQPAGQGAGHGASHSATRLVRAGSQPTSANSPTTITTSPTTTTNVGQPAGQTFPPVVAVTPVDPELLNEVSSAPSSVFNAVGTNEPLAYTLSQPFVFTGKPPMTLGGRTPSMIFYGAEFCPYSAAARWSVVVALSRFGTWKGLKTTISSPTDVYASTSTFTFRTATLSSRYINFVGIERYGNTLLPDGAGYAPLENPTPAEQQLLDTYSKLTKTYAGCVGFPFTDIDNEMILANSTFSPAALTGLSWDEIASNLDDPTNPVTQAIVAGANFVSAGVCASTDQRPASVCTSSGVEVASAFLGLS
jgi:hypothetical protein